MKKKSKPKIRKKKNPLMGTIKILFVLGMCSIFILSAMILWYSQDLPNINTVETASKRPGIVFLTSDHHEIAATGDVAGEIVVLKHVPKPLIQALLATEDRNFYSHGGIDWWGLVRAMLHNIVAGRFAQGGSTLTQQLAKNLFLSPERSISRKVKELLMAFWLERHFTKDEILTIYLNRVYLGRQTYGIDAAAQQYFSKLYAYLSLPEAAVIVGLLKAPSRYSRQPDDLKRRAAVVLHRMKEEGYLNPYQYKTALQKLRGITFFLERRDQNILYFCDWILTEAKKHVDIEQDLIITTTLDRPLQQKASRVIRKQIALHGKDRKVGDAAFIALGYDGAVKAMLGGSNYNKNQFNIAVQARRQAGSSFKPVIYLAALESGYNPDELFLSDDSYKNKNWTVNNFGWQNKGQISMRDALVYSTNTPTVRLAEMVGLKKIMDVAKRLGFKTLDYNLSIALGTAGTNLLELATMMGIIANHGKKIEPYGILEIRSMEGQLLYKRPEEAPETILFHEDLMEKLEGILQESVERGTGNKAFIPGVMVRGKTGTSQKYRDAYFIGYTPNLIAGVWMGNRNDSPMEKISGAWLPTETWKKIVDHNGE